WVEAMRATLPVTQRCVYFQTGTKCPPSEIVLDALDAAERLAARGGPVSPDTRAPLLAAAEDARATLAALLGVPARELCWSYNTSTAMRTVMHALAPSADDHVITSDQEHGATRSLCQGLADARGVNITALATDGDDDAFL